MFAQNTDGKRMVRVADSVGATIAEGVGRGESAKAKRSGKIARGSLFEFKHWLGHAYSRGLISRAQIKSSREPVKELTPKMSVFINSIGKNTQQPATHSRQRAVSMRQKTLVICMMCFWLLSTSMPVSDAATTDTAQADFIPWSGYWWPTNFGGLATGQDYRGHPAPIEKYELLTTGRYPGQATAWELANHYDPTVPTWYGLCYAWASAAVTEDIDFKPSVEGSTILYVGDKKGLITACHANDVRDMANGTFPEVFHQWLLHYIKDNGLAFVGELEPSEEFWSYPIYRYSMTITRSGGILDVACQIWYADDAVHPDLEGTKVLTSVYTYQLFLNAQEEITGGQWTGRSVYDHPGLLWRPVVQAAKNPYLNYQVIRPLAEAADDKLEQSGTAPLPPGNYRLALLDEDDYTIPCETGDKVLLRLTRTEGLPGGIRLTILNARGAVVESLTVSDQETLVFSAGPSPYSVHIAAAQNAATGFYSLELDLKKAYEFLIPKVLKGGAWLGAAITNSGEQECRNICIVGCQQDYRCVATLAAPFSLAPGEKTTALISSLAPELQQQIYSVKILSDAPLRVTSLNGNQNQNLTCYGGPRGDGPRLVLPDISTGTFSADSLWWGLCNREWNDELVIMKLYSSSGAFLGAKAVTIPANGSLNYAATDRPFQATTDNGWVMVEGQALWEVTGYATWLKNRLTQGESLFALTRIGEQFFVPHLACNSLWRTTLTIINLSDRDNQVLLRLHAHGETQDVVVTLAPRVKRAFNVQQCFPTLDPDFFREATLTVESAREITGFFSYETNAALAYFPLMTEEDRKPELVAPHIAANGYWWTGIALFNPGDQPVSLVLEPRGRRGEVLADQVQRKTLGAKEKYAVTASQAFEGPRLADVGWLDVKVESGGGVAGFCLYGDTGMRTLSGAVMESNGH